MALLRRRQSSNARRMIIPVVSIATFVLLFLLTLISFLAPPPVDKDRRHQHTSLSNGVRYRREESKDKDPPVSFRVPISGGSSGHDLWSSKSARFYYGCSNASNKFTEFDTKKYPGRYLTIATSGGLNQQRTGITDAVVAARILNATLVVPKLDQNSFWKDPSNFSEIFDVDWFISSLSKDVKIIKQLPVKRGKTMVPRRMRVPRKCTARCYQNRVLPVMKRHAVLLTKFDYRLANKLETDLQKLRCRVNYHALRFTDPILQMGQLVVKRMRVRAKHFLALHLRFEPDMLAFSGCYYGGGEKERRELGAIRKRWKTLHASNPDKGRRQGKCPLTPEEVGLMLRALGFGNDVHIYVASGEVYGGEETLAPLKALFPNFYTKETLARREELAAFSLFSSRMAALDFMVCDESDVFVTNNNGNMAKILAGRRRYFGHKLTIRPNAKKLYSLFLNRTTMNWDTFASKVRVRQRGFMGEPNEVRPGRGEFHENPSACICENAEAKKRKDLGRHSPTKVSKENEKLDKASNDIGEAADEYANDDEPDWPDTDDGAELPEKELSNADSDYDSSLNNEEPELDEILSD